MNEVKYDRSEILNFIKRYSQKHGYAPSHRDIALAMGVNSTSLVTYWLDELEGEGLIRRDKKIARSVVVL